MLRLIIVVTSFAMLLGAAVLELLCIARGLRTVKIASALMALGCGLLAIRLGYLIVIDDIGRLSVWGSFPIFIIAFARVLACSKFLKESL